MHEGVVLKSAITICLVPEAGRGPFVFHGGLEAGCRAAADAGFDGVELFPAGADDVAVRTVNPLLAAHGLALAAVGLALTANSQDDVRRRREAEHKALTEEAAMLRDAAAELRQTPNPPEGQEAVARRLELR